jgi:hypothetical protein
MMEKVIECKTVREEDYELLSLRYDPEHELVPDAGGNLIEALSMTGYVLTIALTLTLTPTLTLTITLTLASTMMQSVMPGFVMMV